MSDLIYIRVLQHDTEDNIRIGAAYPVADLDRLEQGTIEVYEKEFTWCGGFAAACEKYYQRIAIVDAETLQELLLIYKRKEA
jgi:hypothetical protein